MKRLQDNIALLEAVASALGPLRTKVVFVGGIIAGLLISNQQLHDVRPTDDVDMIVETASYAKYEKLIEELRKLGFQHDMHGPRCRLIISGIKVDVMPADEDILGFSNKWYSIAIETAIPYELPDFTTINIINAPAFIATKLEAFKGRGNGDYGMSHDLEDIVTVINGHQGLLCECWSMPVELRRYLRDSFKELQEEENFMSAIVGLLPYGFANRQSLVEFTIDQLARIPDIQDFSGQIMVNYAETPQSIEVISMSGTKQMMASRVFAMQEEFEQCLNEIGISAEERSANNRLYYLKNMSLSTMSKWRLIQPID